VTSVHGGARVEILLHRGLNRISVTDLRKTCPIKIPNRADKTDQLIGLRLTLASPSAISGLLLDKGQDANKPRCASGSQATTKVDFRGAVVRKHLVGVMMIMDRQSAGNSKPTIIPVMAITTKSSTSVKAKRREDMGVSLRSGPDAMRINRLCIELNQT
jgi:hypothetical protein